MITIIIYYIYLCEGYVKGDFPFMLVPTIKLEVYEKFPLPPSLILN